MIEFFAANHFYMFKDSAVDSVELDRNLEGDYPTAYFTIFSHEKTFRFNAIGSDAADTEIRLIRPGKETEVISFAGPHDSDFKSSAKYAKALDDWNKEMINKIPEILSRVIAFAEGI